MIAVELYRVMKAVERLEKELQGLKPDSPERSEREKRLREARGEHARLKNMLEGAKE